MQEKPQFLIPYMYTGVSWPVNNLNMTAGIVFILICWKKERHLILKAFMALIHYIVKIIACKKSEKGWWLCVLTISLLYLTQGKRQGCGVQTVLHNCTVLAYYLEAVLKLNRNWTVSKLKTYFHSNYTVKAQKQFLIFYNSVSVSPNLLSLP